MASVETIAPATNFHYRRLPGTPSLRFPMVSYFVLCVSSRPDPVRNPFNPQSLISHLTNSNGCGNLQVKVTLTVSPCRPSFNPPRDVFPHPLLANQLNFCASCANSFSSIICALFNSLAALFRARFLCFQQFAHSFTKTPGVGGGHPDPTFGLSLGGDAPGAAQPEGASAVYASTFRINTCKSVSKQMTLTPFRMNTYGKPRGRGWSK
jgi:hypothetical protein